MRALCLLLLGAIGAFCQDASQEAKFREFEVLYHRSYSQEDRPHRLAAFLVNLEAIPDLQAQNGGHAQFSYLSPFADLSHDEYMIMHGYQSSSAGLPCQWSEKGKGPELKPTATAKSSLDYVQLGATAPVKNQGTCGSCWAFSTVAVVEGRLKLDTGNLVSLSEQYLQDCDAERACSGCKCGGLTERAMHWLASGNGIPSEISYPYVEKDEKCIKGKPFAAQVLGFGQVVGTNLEAALTQYGPVAQAFDPTMIHMYKSGIITKPTCEDFKHMMVYVGYGAENGVKYWKIRNSYGTQFGEAGYFRVIRPDAGSAVPSAVCSNNGCLITATSVKAASPLLTQIQNTSSITV